MKIKKNVFLILLFLLMKGFLFGQSCPPADFTVYHYCTVATTYFEFDVTNYDPSSTFIWYFGDGDSATVSDFYVSHLYADTGTYTVTLKEQYNPLCPTTTKTMLVYAYDSKVVLTPSATTVLVNTPVELSFTVLYSSYPATYALDLAGPIVDPATSPYYWTPTVPGTYNIILHGNFRSVGGAPFCDMYDTVTINVVSCPVCENRAINPPAEICVGNPAVFSSSGCTEGISYTWDFGDGVTSASAIHTYTAAGSYLVRLSLADTLCHNPFSDTTATVVVTDCPNIIGCDDCIGSFAPLPGDYIVGAWVKQAYAESLTTYANAGVKISFVGSGVVYGPFMPDSTTKIIDGWQRIESPKWAVPVGATQIVVELVNSWYSDVFFDDIRIHPFNSNMKSYVYDPVTLRLVAELDENNYATFYEYDEDGALIRVKKETERGIVTIKETRNNNKK